MERSVCVRERGYESICVREYVKSICACRWHILRPYPDDIKARLEATITTSHDASRGTVAKAFHEIFRPLPNDEHCRYDSVTQPDYQKRNTTTLRCTHRQVVTPSPGGNAG